MQKNEKLSESNLQDEGKFMEMIVMAIMMMPQGRHETNTNRVGKLKQTKQSPHIEPVG